MRYVVAVFLFGFAAVHGGYEPTPQKPGQVGFWNQNYGNSWLLNGLGLPAEAIKPIVALLWLGPMLCFLLSGLSVLGWWVPGTWFRPLVVAGSAGSVLLALLFWHPWQWLSVVVDLAMLAVVLRTQWAATLGR